MIIVCLIIILYENVVLKAILLKCTCMQNYILYVSTEAAGVQWIDPHINSLKLLCFPFQHISCISPSSRLSVCRNFGDNVMSIASKECFGLADTGVEGDTTVFREGKP
jgi:hypothetical protein